MHMLLKFGVGANAFVFPQASQTSFDFNFADTMQQSVRLIGKDGAISPFGTGRPPAEMGNVSVSYIVESLTQNPPDALDMGHQIAMFRSLPYRGQQRLYMKHQNGRIMWTWALCSSVQTPHNVSNRPHQYQRVQLTFQCQDSKWYYTDGQIFFDDGMTFGDGLVFPPLKLDQESVGNSSTVSVTNYGNAPASPIIQWDIPSGVTATNPTLTWSNVDGNVIYSVQYTASLGGNDIVIINCKDLSVLPSFSNLTVTHGAWMEIPPGSHTLTVTGTFSANVDLSIDFQDAWV